MPAGRPTALCLAAAMIASHGDSLLRNCADIRVKRQFNIVTWLTFSVAHVGVIVSPVLISTVYTPLTFSHLDGHWLRALALVQVDWCRAQSPPLDSTPYTRWTATTE